MLQPSSSFSRVGTLLQTAGNGNSARAGAGEAGVSPPEKPHPNVDEISADLLAEITSLPDVEVVSVHREPAHPGELAEWPGELDPRLHAALSRTAMARPYAHQARAVQAVARGEDVVIATGTASGKSLCFQLPLVDAVLTAPSSRALLLFPTKALARDQVEGMRALGHGLGLPAVGLGTYDGDTPPEARRAARARAHAIATNPDMLHRGILPHHESWARFLGSLRFVVIDELHVYRGLFGSHVANVLRRLFRLCTHYGSRPRVIACSATIGNPAELAQGLCARPFTLVDADASPRGPKRFVVLNPGVVDPLTGVRRDYLKVTRQVTTVLRARGLQTLAFCRTRKAVELLTRYLRDDEVAGSSLHADAHGSSLREREAERAIRGYRGGYLPDRRREVERALREGEARVVASTNALELGIDIGGVDAVVLSGYPGSRAATWQRAGRAGRRRQPALTVLCLSSKPLDQFLATDPSFLWDRSVEHARIDPDHPEVLLPHLRCAAAEMAFGRGSPTDALPGVDPEDLEAGLQHLAAQGGLLCSGGDAPVYAVAGDEVPSTQVDLRGTLEQNFAVLDDASGDVLAEVDFDDAPLYIHVGAIYTVEGRTHEVRRLDWDERKAYVRPVTSDYYTEAICKLQVRVLEPEGEEPERGHGYAHVVRSVPGFKKIRFETHENIGFGPIALPDLELHTCAAYWPSAQAFLAAVVDPGRRAAAALAAAHVLHHVAAMMLMCDPGDLGSAVLAGHPSAWGPVLLANRRPSSEAVLAAGARPFVLLYDRAAGGAGLSPAAFARSRALLERAVAVVTGCRCERGCPTCMGPMSDDSWDAERADVAAWLRAAAREMEGSA